MQRRFRYLSLASIVGLFVLSIADCGRRPSAVGIREACDTNTRFLIGSGIYDITGPAADVGMMGYGAYFQRTAGIHTRLRSRAFVIESPCNKKRVVLVTVDLQGMPHAVKHEVVQWLHDSAWGAVYGDENLLISATHTHSVPGGFHYNRLYQLLRTPFNRQTFDAIVGGIVGSIRRAHNSLAPGRIKVASGALLGATINRSPVPYRSNHDTSEHDTDTLMTVLRFEDMTGHPTGVISWFAVHGTSMSSSNRLISADNKGYASYLFERAKETRYDAETTFVAAFAQSDEGDASPNICSKDLSPAGHGASRRQVPLNANCQGRTRGEGSDDFESTRISGQKQYNAARMLFDSASEFLSGSVDYRHTYVRMDSIVLPDSAGHSRRTVPAAIGLALLTGTPDGHGMPFTKPGGITCRQAEKWPVFWPFRLPCVNRPPWEGQGVKPWVPLDTLVRMWKTGLKRFHSLPEDLGENSSNIPPFPSTLPAQIVVIGDLALVAVPFELTTVAGRRLRETVETVLKRSGVRHVVIAGLANDYASYVTTPDEYDLQYYEGASTLFGRWTLEALRQEYRILADSLQSGGRVEHGPEPADTIGRDDTDRVEVPWDGTPGSKAFGDVHRDAKSDYRIGMTVSVTFWGGNPDNDLRTQRTFLEIQFWDGESWATVANDWDWETRYRWKPDHSCFTRGQCSLITIEWTVPSGTQSGNYRICHYGESRSQRGDINHYVGTSRVFGVTRTGQRIKDNTVDSTSKCVGR